MLKKLGRVDLNTLLGYVVGGSAWIYPETSNERPADTEIAFKQWNEWLPTLDTAILGMLGEYDIDDSDIEAKLVEVLTSSLWLRRLARRSEALQKASK